MMLSDDARQFLNRLGKSEGLEPEAFGAFDIAESPEAGLEMTLLASLAISAKRIADQLAQDARWRR